MEVRVAEYITVQLWRFYCQQHVTPELKPFIFRTCVNCDKSDNKLVHNHVGYIQKGTNVSNVVVLSNNISILMEYF